MVLEYTNTYWPTEKVKFIMSGIIYKITRNDQENRT